MNPDNICWLCKKKCKDFGKWEAHVEEHFRTLEKWEVERRTKNDREKE